MKTVMILRVYPLYLKYIQKEKIKRTGERMSKKIELVTYSVTPTGLVLSVPDSQIEAMRTLGKEEEFKQTIIKAGELLADFIVDAQTKLEEENEEVTSEEEMQLIRKLVGNMDISEANMKSLLKLAKELFKDK